MLVRFDDSDGPICVVASNIRYFFSAKKSQDHPTVIVFDGTASGTSGNSVVVNQSFSEVEAAIRLALGCD